MTIPRFHDAILCNTNVDWQLGSALITLTTAESDKLLSVVGLKSLSCPRFEPWGPSFYVNSTTHITGETGRQSLEIEMQSGDLIRIEADLFTMIDQGGR